MGYTRVQLYNEVVAQTGLSSTDERMSTTLVYGDINRGLRRMATEMDWPWLQRTATITTVADQQAYSLPADHTRTFGLYLTNADGLVGEIEAIQRRDLMGVPTLQLGPPWFYSIYNNQISFYPVPNGVFTITHDYIRSEVPLTNDSDQILCPDIYVDAVVFTAAQYTAARIPDKALYENLKELKKDYWGSIYDNLIKSYVAPTIKVRSV